MEDRQGITWKDRPGLNMEDRQGINMKTAGPKHGR